MGLSLKERVALLPSDQKVAWASSLPDQVLDEVRRGEWWWTSRPEQVPPMHLPWLICLALAGRGYGKTRSSSEWIVDRVLRHPFDRHGVPTEWLVVADTLSDARTINAEGPSGILNVLRRRKVDHRYKQSPRPMVLFPDGAKIYLEGADDTDTGRGYNAAGVVLDELAKWLRPYETWYEGILPSLRADLVGDHPRAFVTTTPKPIALLEEWVTRTDGTIHIIVGSTFDNASNLSSQALAELKLRYDGTALGDQELYGKLLDLGVGGLFRRTDIAKNRVKPDEVPEAVVSTVVGCDPNLTGSDAMFGIVVACRDTEDELYILADCSVPESGRQAALAVWRACAQYKADVVLYEENLGKRFLKEVLADAYQEMADKGFFPKNSSPPMESVHAKHGKKTRAEPVAMRNQQGRLHMVGYHEDLEKEMVRFDPASTRESPDRMDAMVHACLKLMSGEKKRMRVGNAYDYDFQLTQDLYGLDSLGF